MAPSNNIESADMRVVLETRLADLNAQHAEARQACSLAVMKAQPPSDADQANIDALDAEVQRLERAVVVTERALADLGEAHAAIATEADAAEAKKVQDRLKAGGRELRQSLQALDTAADAFAAAYADARTTIGKLYDLADGPMRASDQFADLPMLVGGVAGIMLARVSYLEPRIAIPNVAGFVMRDGPAPSVEGRFNPFLEGIAPTPAPAPGRPKKASATPVVDTEKKDAA